MLRRRGLYAIKALLELAEDPLAWCPVSRIAAAQAIPVPMLEQLLLRLRRAALVEARRGRTGGYRLARPAASIPLAAVLQAVDADPARAVLAPEPPGSGPDPGGGPPPGLAGERVTAALERRLRLALQRELAALTLEELLFDLRSWQECLREDGGLMLG